MDLNVRRLIWIPVALAGCASSAPQGPALVVLPPSSPVAQPAPPDPICAALAQPIRHLNGFMGSGALPAHKGKRPLFPERFAVELEATAPLVRAVAAGDDVTAKLVADTADLFVALAGRARDLAAADVAKRDTDVQAGISALYGTMESGSTVLKRLQERCNKGNPARSGRLDPVVIQKIVRANFGAFRQCYEDGLRRDPKLEGHVSIRFVIGRDGAVSAVRDADQEPPDGHEWGSSSSHPEVVMPDTQVSACVVAAFRKLSFPPPDGGIVTVTYPIMFAPGG
jgi:hypothetical protein